MAVKERVQWVDTAKGIGLFLVIIGHIPVPDSLLWFIYAFHMPLFIMMSGMFFNPSKVLKNVKKLLICHISMNLITSVIYTLVKRLPIMWFLQNLIKIMMGGSAPAFRLDNSPAGWFFTGLIAVELLALLKHKLEGRLSVIKYIFSPICMVLAFLCAKFELNRFIFWNIIPALFLFPFYDLGTAFNSSDKMKSIVKRAENNNFVINIAICVVLGIITFLISHYNGNVNIYRSNYGSSVVLYYIGSLTGTVMAVILSTMLSNNNSAVVRYFKWTGRNTIVTMSIHQLLATIVNIIAADADIHKYLLTLIKFIVIMIICPIATIIVNKFFPFLIGAKKKKVNKAI